MACDQSCGAMYTQGGTRGEMGCEGGMVPQGVMGCGMGNEMGYPVGGWGHESAGCLQRPASMGYQQGSMGYQPGPASMSYQQGPMGYQRGPASMSYQQGPMGYQPGPFEPGSGCGGLNVACGPQGTDIPPQARPRKPRPPSSTVPKRKLGTSYTTLVTPLAGAKQLTEEETKNVPPDHERFDTLTLAFGTKPGTDKPPKILLTLKSPKVIDAKLGTGTTGTQVNYKDLGLPDPNAKPDDTKSRTSKISRKSKGSKRGSKKSSKTSKSKKSKKPSKGKKGKK